jgi:DNA-binding NarL/FixJ family response regulator
LIKVGVVAETMAMRVGLREVIKALPDLIVMSAVARSQDLPADPLDVLVLVSPTDMAGLENAQAVLYLTDELADIQGLLNFEFLTWGALPINASEAELNIAIRALAEGMWVGAPTLVRKLFSRNQLPGPDESEYPPQTLTDREIEVLQLTAQGLANKQIAARLGISEHTIKFHLSSLYSKLGVSSRTEAVRSGVRHGLVVL